MLTLLDGLEPRRAVYVVATTNRPQAIDSALRRPGRFDRVVTMGLPKESGRAAILRHHLSPLRLAGNSDREALAHWLATQTRGASGADLAYLCQSAARHCVRQELERREQRDSPGQSPLPEHNVAVTTSINAIPDPNILPPNPPLAIKQAHFDLSLREWLAEHAPSSPRPTRS